MYEKQNKQYSNKLLAKKQKLQYSKSFKFSIYHLEFKSEKESNPFRILRRNRCNLNFIPNQVIFSCSSNWTCYWTSYQSFMVSEKSHPYLPPFIFVLFFILFITVTLLNKLRGIKCETQEWNRHNMKLVHKTDGL